MSNPFQSKIETPIVNDVVTHVVITLLDYSVVPLKALLEALPVLLKNGYRTVEVPGHYDNYLTIISNIMDLDIAKVVADDKEHSCVIEIDFRDSAARVTLIILR